MWADPAVEARTGVAVEAPHLVVRREVVLDDVLIDSILTNLLAVFITVIVLVVNGQETKLCLAAAGTFIAIMSDNSPPPRLPASIVSMLMLLAGLLSRKDGLSASIAKPGLPASFTRSSVHCCLFLPTAGATALPLGRWVLPAGDADALALEPRISAGMDLSL
jgi:hypothetical protein